MPLSEIFDGIKWRLSRAPEEGYPMPGTSPQAYLFKIDPIEESLPLVAALYKYDDNEVTIMAIRIIER